MSPKKTIKDLSKKELLEDLKYYVCYANTQSPSFTDKTFDIILKYVNELEERPPDAMGKELIEKFLDDITPEKLHQFYLEAIKLLNSNSYNPNANVPYEQLSEEQKQIDKYIADKLKEKWE